MTTKNKKSSTSTTKKTDSDNQLSGQDFDLWDALAALDKKDYGYYSRLTPEQQNKFSPYMLIIWFSSVKARGDLADYYLRSVDSTANQYFMDEAIQQHPELQWLMLCAASPGLGRQQHAYIPQLTANKINFREPISTADAIKYFSKLGWSEQQATEWSYYQQRAAKLAQICEYLNVDDLGLLAGILTDSDIEAYYRECGN